MRMFRLVVVLTLIIGLLVPVPVIANGSSDRDLEAELAALQQQLWALQLENARLQATPPQPTPAPVFAPNLRLVSPQNINLEPGESVDIQVTIRNIGTHTASAVLTQAIPASGSPFSAEFLNNSNSVSSISQNSSRNMNLRITVDHNAEPGGYSISLHHFFRNQAGDNMETSDTISVRIGGQVMEPSIRLGSFQNLHPGAVMPGQTFNTSVNVQNIGSGAASDIRIGLPSMRADEIFFMGDLSQAVIPSLDAGGQVTMNFQFQASERASGTFPIEFLVLYRDASGRNQEEETFTFFVNIAGGVAPNLEIRGMQSPSGQIGVGGTGTFSFSLYNFGQTEARSIRVEANPESGDVVPMGTPNVQNFSSLAPGASIPLSFSFSPRASAATQSYTIDFAVSFLDGPSGERVTFHQSAAFSVFNPERPEADNDDNDVRTQIPRIIVSRYTVDPQIPRAGREFDMEITFRNTNMTRSVNNIRITLEALEGTEDQGAVFTPVGGSNTLFINFMAPGEEVTKNLRFFTVNDALQRAYNIRVTFEYQCSDFEEFEATENLSVSVAQIVRIETDGLNIDSHASVGQNVWIRFNVLNTGRVPLYAMRVRVDGPFDASEANIFIGNLAAQRQITYDGQFRPLEAGTLNGALVIYGEDATGALVEYVHDFIIHVDEGMGMMDDWGDDFLGGDIMWGDDMRQWDGNGEGAGFFGLIRRPYVWIPIVVVLAGAVAAATAILVRRKRSKLNFEDEDL